MTLEAYHTPKVQRALAATRRALGFVTLSLSLLVVWLLAAWQKALYSEITYFVTPVGTHAAFREPPRQHGVPHAFEIENFTALFLENAFAHNEYTYEEHLGRALAVMDTPSGQYLQSKFHEEDILAVFAQYNGLSQVELERVEIAAHAYPFLVTAYYTIQMRFIGLEEGKAVPGAVQFVLQSTARSRENPYGLLVTDFRFVPYEKLAHQPPG